MVTSVSDRAMGAEVVMLDADAVRRWVRASADQLAANRDFLTQLDAAIGDADHGVNMDRGFSAAVVDLEATPGSTAGEMLERVGTTLVYRVGGAAGPLFGSMYRAVGAAMGSVEWVDGERLLEALRAGLEAVQSLGAAVVGDKTLVDAYEPALAALERDLRAGGTLATSTRHAAEAAREGVRSTIPLQARKGRASYLGARSVGHQDPGATSTGLLFSALAMVVDQDP